MTGNTRSILSLRRGVLMTALAVSVVCALWTYWQDADQDSPAPASAFVGRPSGAAKDSAPEGKPRPRAAPAAQAAEYFELGSRKAAHVQSNPFAPLAVIVPVQPKLAPVAVVKVEPKAPPLPFQYLGRLVQQDAGSKGAPADKGKTVIYLGRGSDTFAVSAGEKIDENYQLVGLDGDNLIIQYLPLSQRQTLSTGSSN